MLPLAGLICCCICGSAESWAQGGSFGAVPVEDATVSAPAAEIVAVSGGRALLGGVNTVTAKPGRNADLTLTRGGSILVCQTSSLHAAGAPSGPLLLALDRGAMEIRLNRANLEDVVMTPDLRFTMASSGPLDLRLRVSFNGDTCVENHGKKAPLLRISDSFGEASYEVRAGQHVLFEHGSLREVVDRETTPCGCPPDGRGKVSIAEAALHGNGVVTPKQAEAAHPFPVAASEGMTAKGSGGEPMPADAPEATHVQVATTLTYDPSAAPPVKSGDEAAETLSGSTGAAAQQKKGGPVRAVGRFFKRIFVR